MRITSLNIASALLATLGMALSGCGSVTSSMSGMLSSIQAGMSEQNGDLWADISAQIDTGGMILASANVPIVNPKDPSEVYGNLDLQADACASDSTCSGDSTLTISVNITQVADVQASSNELPNGTQIPLAAPSGTTVVGIPIGGSGATLYVGLGPDTAILGVAMPFSALNEIGEYAPGVDIFDSFTLNNVTGLVGIFAGSANDTTGFGLFIDLSNLINTGSSTTSSAVASAEAVSQVQSAAQPKLSLTPVHPSASVVQGVDYELYEMSSRRVHLKLQ